MAKIKGGQLKVWQRSGALKVIEAEGPKPATRSMLQSMGYGVKGVPEGFGLPVKCDETNVSGWMNAASELQSFIVPAKGWFFERLEADLKPVDVVMKPLKLKVPDLSVVFIC